MVVGQPTTDSRPVRDRPLEVAPPEVAVDYRHLAAGDAGGVPLARLLERDPLPTPQAIVVGLGILVGLRDLRRRGLGHGSIDTSSVLVDRRGHARLLGEGSADVIPHVDVVAAGRVLCAALGIDPRHQPPRASRRAKQPSFMEGLAAAARTIASGGAGASATSALVMFGDAAGRMGPGLRIQRTAAAIERLAIPPPTAIMAAVDRVMVPSPMPAPAAANQTVTPPAAVAAPASAPAPAAKVVPAPAADPAPVPARAPEPVKAAAVETTTPPHLDPLAAVVAAVIGAVVAPTSALAQRAEPVAPKAPVTSAPPSAVQREAVVPKTRVAAPPELAIYRKADAPLRLNPQPRRHLVRALAIPLAIVGASLLGLLLLLPRHQPAQRTTGAPVSAVSVATPAAHAEAAPPAAVVTQFYQLVAAHKFDQALALWDDNARTMLGPSQYPSHRFADTTQMSVNCAKVTSDSASTAVVAVDLTEQTDGVLHHWVGTWRLVNSNGAWLLDTPAFQEA